jgi:hypothetical protein
MATIRGLLGPRARTHAAPTATIERAAHASETGAERKPSGMCIGGDLEDVLVAELHRSAVIHSTATRLKVL